MDIFVMAGSIKGIASTLKKRHLRLVYVISTMIVVIAIVVGYIQYTAFQRNKQFTAGKETVQVMTVGVINAVEMCSEISETWRDAIKNGDDFNTRIRRKIHELDSSNGAIIQKSKEKVDELMKSFNTLPQGMERHQQKSFKTTV